MNSKKRAVQLKLDHEKTGSTGDNIKELSESDSRVISILSWDAIDGDGQTQEYGLPLPVNILLSEYLEVFSRFLGS